MTTWQERISINPRICHGQPCLQGTCVLVSIILDNLATGLSEEEVLASYPPLTVEDIQAAREYPATLEGAAPDPPVR